VRSVFFFFLVFLSASPALPGLADQVRFQPDSPGPPAPPGLRGQVRFEEAIRQLTDPDKNIRLRTVQMLNAAAYPEAAVPLAAAVTDPDDSVQLEAIAAELNIFLAEKAVPRRRVALVIERRENISAEAVFNEGPLALNANPVPVEVVNALRVAARDENSRVAVDALYAFGELAGELSGEARRELLRVSAPALAGMFGTSDPAVRLAAIRASGRVFALRPGDTDVDQTLGDAMTMALNDRQEPIRAAALDALGSLRYERAVQALIDLVQYYRRDERGASALAALARIAHPSTASIFVGELTAGSRVTKISAIEGLARLGDRAQVVAIRAALARERNEAVLLAQRFSSVLLDNGSLDSLFSALGKSGTHDQALRYLIELAPGRSAAFAAPARDGDSRRRADVAFILAMAGDAAALPIVEPMTRDRDPQVVRAADRAVARLRRPS
jgi:HEAT repeat protein